MIEVQEFYDLIYKDTGLKRNRLSEQCTELANSRIELANARVDQMLEEVALGFVSYLEKHKHSLLDIREDFIQFRKKENI